MDGTHNGKQEILNVTENYVTQLMDIWSICFGSKMVEENLRKLEEHVRCFYDDLIEQTIEKREFIQDEIRDLREEAEHLRRQLRTSVELPQINDDLPLIFVQSELDKSLEDLREQLRLRREQIAELLQEQETLCEELGEPPRELLADPLPSEREIDDFRGHLNGMKELRCERLNELSTLRREIRDFQKILDLQVTTDAEDRLLNHAEIKLNKETFAALHKLHKSYGGQAEELQHHIDEMRRKLETLWQRLQISPDTRNKFDRHSGYSQYTYDLYYAELQRCETLRSQNIKKYVQEIRQEILELWDKTLKSDAERRRFAHFNSSRYSDDLLLLHELELDDLKRYYETNREIFQMFNDRKVLWDRMIALEAKANEPGRFNNRGGQLLKEEKERKTIASKLPKIEQQIRDLVQQYEERENSPFLIDGENIITLMADEWERKREAKEKVMTTRKNLTGGRSTPVTKNANTSRGPMSLKNASSVSSLNKMSAIKTRTNMMVAVNSQNRKMVMRQKSGPLAKRSLMNALNSPTVCPAPTLAVTAPTPPKKSATKSTSKASRIIASTIRRRSGPHKSSVKKRLSQSRRRLKMNNSSDFLKPQHYDGSGVGHEVETDQATSFRSNHDEDHIQYEFFQKCIEPDSRSSVIPHNRSNANCSFMWSGSSPNARRQRQLDLIADENARLAYLPNPRLARTASKQNLAGMSPHPQHHSSTQTSARKLNTKNLPIII